MSSQKKTPNKFIGYVNIYLNEAQKSGVGAALMGNGEVIDQIAEWSEEGYSVSIKWDHQGACHVVSLVGQYTSGITAGRAISQRHTDICKAFTALHYIVDKEFAEGAWVEVNLKANAHDW